jgi:hypothetical protein
MVLPTTFCDIFPNHYLYESHPSKLDDFVNTDFNGSFFPQCIDGGLESAFLMYNEVPGFTMPTPIARTPSISSMSSMMTSTSSLDSESIYSSELSSFDSASCTSASLDWAETSPEVPSLQGNGHLAPVAMRVAQRRARRPGPLRRRGPNKRRPGTGYADMMVRSFKLVQNRVTAYSPRCCKGQAPGRCTNCSPGELRRVLRGSHRKGFLNFAETSVLEPTLQQSSA